MKRLLLLLAGLCFSAGVLAATTYTYTGGQYTSFTNFTAPCASGPCQNYLAGSSINGSFTTGTALAAGLTNANVYPSVTGFSFTDGINTYSSADVNARVWEFIVSTGPSGNISAFQILVQLWRTGSSPHSTADRFSYILITSPGGVNAENNQPCGNTVGVSVAGVPDTCIVSNGPDASSSRGQTASVGTWVGGAIGPVIPPATTIPTLSDWAMIVLSLLLAAFAVYALRRRSR